ALDRRIVGDDHALAPGHPPDAGDDPCARGFVTVHTAGGQRCQLEKRAARVEQPIHPFAGQQLAATHVTVPRTLIAAQRSRGELVLQLPHQPAMLLGERRRNGCRRHGAGTRIVSGGCVFATTSSTDTSGAVSIRCRPSAQTSITASSVTIRFTHPTPVSGSVHRSRIFGLPSLAACSIITITLRAPCTRSIAPPMPLTILPGIIQLARSPATETCMAPSTATSSCPPP